MANRGAALAILTIEPVIRARLEGKAPPRPIDALRDAMRTLKTHFGRLDPEWGHITIKMSGHPDIHRLARR